MTIPELYSLYLQHPVIQTDSRRLKPGDFFFALKGAHFNGNIFAAQALEQGAAYALVDEPEYANTPGCILVEDVLDSLQQLATYHRSQLPIPVLAITGSNGKTTTKELVTAVLSTRYKVHATQGNLNNHIGVPLTLLGIRNDAEIAIVEMGANHIGEIAAYCPIAQPDYGMITNIGKAHLEGFGSLEGVRKAKGELYDYIRKTGGAIFRNTDLEYLADMSADIKEQITYGTTRGQVTGKSLEAGPLLQVELSVHDTTVNISTQLVGQYNLANVLAAASVGHHFQVDLNLIHQAIEAYKPSNSRSQWIEVGSRQIILDAYNANPISMKMAIENIAGVAHDNKWLLLGSMKELGATSAQEHQAIIDLAQQLHFRNVILTGPEFEQTDHPYLWLPDSEGVRNYLVKHPIDNALLLIKGSRGSRMEITLEAFS